MCRKHFPNELCIMFAQNFGLAANTTDKINHNKEPSKKEQYLTKITSLRCSFFESSRLTLLEVLTLVMCFISHLTVIQVVQHMGLTDNIVIDWYVFCREICDVILSNEFQGTVGGEGMTMEVDESHLFSPKYGVGRKGKCEYKWLLGCYCRDKTVQNCTGLVLRQEACNHYALAVHCYTKYHCYEFC